MKYFIFLPALLFFAVSTAFAAQQAVPTVDNVDFPSVGTMFSSMTAEGNAKEASLTDSIDKMMQSVSSAGSIDNTQQSVQSATSGRLVVEDVVPEINKTVVEAIDKKTNRYSPRLKLDFANFPLERPASVEAPVPAERIAKHLQYRLRLDREPELEFQDRTVYLRGTVSTERQKELVAMMLRLEPGVDAVKNELVVAPIGERSVGE